MKIDNELIKESAVRFIIISGLIIAAGYYLYQNSVFIPTHWPFQFLVSGITVGIAYAAFSKNHFSTGAAILFVWYIILTSWISDHNTWVLILEGTYITIFSASVYLYIKIIQKYEIENILIRIIISAVLFGIINSLIVVILSLFSPQILLTNFQRVLSPMMLNFGIGTGIGLFFGIGVKLSDSFVKSVLMQNKITG
jgi:hypothetical protein